MSIKIKTHYSQALNIDLLEKNIQIWLRRLSIQVAFKKEKSFSQPYEAIIDTGAPVSIIPPAIWEECKKEVHGEYKIRGLVPKKDAYINVKIGTIYCALFDEDKTTDILPMKAYLSLEPRVPLVFGFEDFLSNVKLYSDCRGKCGYVEL